ncbi:hypothetical protein LTR97_007611 [Elasticomyces elasticus]|uniref:Alpha/beta hydrolase n=1 Tax=Elasticomyces elasticus TaxID=574655 RepID=A0AAN8A045_9PEZI|nr:hypothetical protein LTR97_007611 [Elasticomyces elasticus]
MPTYGASAKDIVGTRMSSRRARRYSPEILENAAPHVDWSDYTGMRAGVTFLEVLTLVQLGAPKTSIHESERQIPMRDGYASTIEIAKPACKAPGGGPLIVLIHGGDGSVSPKTSWWLLPALVRRSGVVAV